MENKIVKGIIVIIGISFFLVLLYEFISLLNDKSTDESIKRVEETSSIALAITSDITDQNKTIDITDEEDISEIKDIANNIIIKDMISIRGTRKFIIPQIILYDNSGKIIAEIILFDVSASVGGKVASIKAEKIKRLKEIAYKYIENSYGKIVCQNGIKTDIYYLYDSNIIKYVNETKDLPENDRLEKLKEKVSKAENIPNYSAYLFYNHEEYGQYPEDENITLKEGYYYYSDSYLIEKMKEQEINNLLNASKSSFENKTAKDIEEKYPQGACEYSIW